MDNGDMDFLPVLSDEYPFFARSFRRNNRNDGENKARRKSGGSLTAFDFPTISEAEYS
jgi:hypothetical protein